MSHSIAIKEQFRHAMREVASSVAVITTGTGPLRTGFTATSLCSLSLEPPRLTITINRSSSSYGILRESGVFAVNLLGPHHIATAQNFAGQNGRKGLERYEGARWTTLQSGAAILSDAAVAIDCRVEELIERHSHGIVIGEVLAVSEPLSGGSLLYWQGKYDPVGTFPAFA